MEELKCLLWQEVAEPEEVIQAISSQDADALM